MTDSNSPETATPLDGLSKEQRILITMRKVLAAVIKDTTPTPGLRHPLTENTIQDIRLCLGLIATRERELADAQGRQTERPYYADEAAQQAKVIPIGSIRRRDH